MTVFNDILEPTMSCFKIPLLVLRILHPRSFCPWRHAKKKKKRKNTVRKFGTFFNTCFCDEPDFVIKQCYFHFKKSNLSHVRGKLAKLHFHRDILGFLDIQGILYRHKIYFNITTHKFLYFNVHTETPYLKK